MKPVVMGKKKLENRDESILLAYFGTFARFRYKEQNRWFSKRTVHQETTAFDRDQKMGEIKPVVMEKKSLNHYEYRFKRLHCQNSDAANTMKYFSLADTFTVKVWGFRLRRWWKKINLWLRRIKTSNVQMNNIALFWKFWTHHDTDVREKTSFSKGVLHRK